MTHTWNPGVAAVLSLLIPGAGQMYKGQVIRGLIYLFLILGVYVLILPIGAVLHIFCIIGAASGLPVDPRAPTPETHVRCPDCQELILKEARKCKHCGCALVPIR